jgi:hypothetical protein
MHASILWLQDFSKVPLESSRPSAARLFFGWMFGEKAGNARFFTKHPEEFCCRAVNWMILIFHPSSLYIGISHHL